MKIKPHLSLLFFLSTTLLLISGCSTGLRKNSASPQTQSLKTGGEIAENPSHRALSRDAAAIRARQISHVAYGLWFDVDATHEDFRGRTVIHFQLKEKAAEASSDLLLDFDSGEIQSMTLNGNSIWSTPEDETQNKARYDGFRIHFKLSELQPGSNRIEIAYAHRYSATGNGLHRFQDPVDNKVYLYSNFEPFNAHLMFPCFDQPDLKASYELTVQAPEAWTVISNTQEREVGTIDGKASWTFPPTPVFSTYLFALHAGPFAVWKSDADGIPIRLFARKSLASYVDSAEWLEITRQGLEFYGNEFGYAYPFAKYDQVIVPDFNSGAMENVGAVTFSERFVFRSKVTQDRHRGRANVILHEMAHMWFGDLVTMRWWNGLWLNESFATLMASIAVDKATRFKGEWQAFFAGNKRWAYWDDQLVTTHPVEVPIPDTDHAFANFDGITYGKGASVLKQLSYFLGEDDFREGLQRYFQKFAYRNTAMIDFIRMLAEAAGKNLTEWQHVWLQLAGLNSIQADWACEEGKVSRLSLLQKAPETNPELRSHRATLALYQWPKGGPKKGAALSVKKTFEVDYSKAETPVPAAIGAPCPDLVYPNHNDLDYVKVVLDPVSLKAAREHLAQIDSSFARQMLWHTLSEMVVHAQMPAQAFADTVMSQGTAEKDTQVLKSILTPISSRDGNWPSIQKFLSGETLKQYQIKIEDFLKKHLETSPPGSDLQLVYWQAYVDAAFSEGAAQYLRSILDNKKKISGLKIEQERRWEIVKTLSSLGIAEASDLIQAELKKDPTDLGKKESMSAEASIPTAENKALWLKRILRKSDQPADLEFKSAQLLKAAHYFHSIGQEEFTRSAIEPYFEALPKLAASEDESYVQGVTGSLFPSLCEQSIVNRVTQFLNANSELPAAVLKSLKTSRQREERCILARALSLSAQAPLGSGPSPKPQGE